MYKDILYILENLREEDRFELFLQYGNNWKKKAFLRLKKSKMIILKEDNGFPFAMGGIEGIDDIACVWLLTTQKVEHYKTKLLKEIKKELDLNSSKYQVYFNYICTSNKQAKKWLSKLGFRFDNPHPKNINVKNGFEFFYRLNIRKGK